MHKEYSGHPYSQGFVHRSLKAEHNQSICHAPPDLQIQLQAGLRIGQLWSPMHFGLASSDIPDEQC